MTIAVESAHSPGIDALLRHSDEVSAALYPPEHRYPANADALSGPGARLLVARGRPVGTRPGATPGRGAALGCVGLLLRDGYGELKRLIVAPEARGLGLGRALLAAVEATATREGLAALRLETGPGNVHALGLYHEAGWTSRGAFGDYRPNPFSLFLERCLGVFPS